MAVCADFEKSETLSWTQTRSAVSRFREFLLCCSCSQLMSEPVCLGACEHMFCRSCAGPSAGKGCSVCHSPAWVMDIQANRQLSNITQLFCQLEAMLNPPSLPATPPADQPNPHNQDDKQKNIKIWFSPRSRKMRCQVVKGPRGRGRGAALKPTKTPPVNKDLSIFSFSSSSQDSGSSPHLAKVKNTRAGRKKSLPRSCGRGLKPAKRTQPKVATQRQTLDNINRLWGITRGEKVPAEGERSRRKVSFKCPNQPEEPKAITTPGSLTSGEVVPAVTSCSSCDPTLPESPCPSLQTKRSRLQDDTTEALSTPKRPKISPGRGRRTRGSSPSPCRLRSCVPRGSGVGYGVTCTSPRTPPILRRNHKGETPLHLAAIKGNVDAVKELLEQGADPNLKDNAGWTPLHEACNLGHLGVVELLLQRGALMNTPGYQNDSPLHDAVRNGHTKVVRFLLKNGASLGVLNAFGFCPADCAETDEMRAILMEAGEELALPSADLSPSPSVSVEAHGQGSMLLLGSGLTHIQQGQMGRLVQLLGAHWIDSFSSSVTHVVVPEGPLPTTLSCLRGILNGCWILTFQWVEACLKANRLVEEKEYEVGEGPARSRINGKNLSPPKEELLQLVKDGGGQILARKPKPDSDVTQTLSAAAYHAPAGSDQALCTQYVLYDPQGSYRPPRVRLGKVWSAPSSWLVDCIAAFRLLPVSESAEPHAVK